LQSLWPLAVKKKKLSQQKLSQQKLLQLPLHLHLQPLLLIQLQLLLQLLQLLLPHLPPSNLLLEEKKPLRSGFFY
jgi:hypothetical protein